MVLYLLFFIPGPLFGGVGILSAFQSVLLVCSVQVTNFVELDAKPFVAFDGTGG